MYCPRCGNNHSERVNFCCGCGANLLPQAPNSAKTLTRSRSDKKIAGVCTGFANYFELDATLIRLVWLLLVIFGGCGLLAYAVAWIIIPQEPAARPVAEKAIAVSPPALEAH